MESELFYISWQEALARLGAAAGFSFLLGLDREIRQKAFGLRTHILLCVGTTAFTLIIMELIYSLQHHHQLVQADPGRIVQAIVVGIGFLAAGTVIQSKESIIGATTGAGIWVVGSIGLACGLGLYLHGIIITTLVLIVVIGLHPFNAWLKITQEKEK